MLGFSKSVKMAENRAKFTPLCVPERDAFPNRKRSAEFIPLLANAFKPTFDKIVCRSGINSALQNRRSAQ